MESYLRNNPAVRWSLILVLVLSLLLEALLITNKLVDDFTLVPKNEANSQNIQPTASAENLSCEVVNLVGLRVREQPFVGDNLIKTWVVNTSFTALGRSGEEPWLLVRVEGQLGWVLSKDDNARLLVECDGDLLALPEISADRAIVVLPQPAADTESGTKATPTARPRAARTPKPTLTSESTATESATASATATANATASATAIPTLTPSPKVYLRSDNGPDLHAARRTFNINMDGRLDEWGNIDTVSVNNYIFQPENRVGSQDLSGLVRAAWDEQHLYLAAQVEDDNIIQESQGDQLHKGDAIELFWDGNLAGDFGVNNYNGDDVQLIFTPAGIVGNLDNLYYVNHSGSGNNGNGIAVWSWQTEVGYDLEIRIPWAVLGVEPQSGATFGYAIALSDDDSPGSAEQETQLATSIKNPLQQPTRWSNFILDP